MWIALVRKVELRVLGGPDKVTPCALVQLPCKVSSRNKHLSNVEGWWIRNSTPRWIRRWIRWNRKVDRMDEKCRKWIGRSIGWIGIWRRSGDYLASVWQQG